jgi:hypothetical protein
VFCCAQIASSEKDGTKEVIAALIDSGADATIPNFMFKQSALQFAPPHLHSWLEGMIAEHAIKHPPSLAPHSPLNKTMGLGTGSGATPTSTSASTSSASSVPPSASASSAAAATTTTATAPLAADARAAAKHLVAEVGKASAAIDKTLTQNAQSSQQELERKLALGKKGAALSKQVGSLVNNTLAEAKQLEVSWGGGEGMYDGMG